MRRLSWLLVLVRDQNGKLGTSSGSRTMPGSARLQP